MHVTVLKRRLLYFNAVFAVLVPSVIYQFHFYETVYLQHGGGKYCRRDDVTVSAVTPLYNWQTEAPMQLGIGYSRWPEN